MEELFLAVCRSALLGKETYVCASFFPQIAHNHSQTLKISPLISLRAGLTMKPSRQIPSSSNGATPEKPTAQEACPSTAMPARPATRACNSSCVRSPASSTEIGSKRLSSASFACTVPTGVFALPGNGLRPRECQADVGNDSSAKRLEEESANSSGNLDQPRLAS